MSSAAVMSSTTTVLENTVSNDVIDETADALTASEPSNDTEPKVPSPAQTSADSATLFAALPAVQDTVKRFLHPALGPQCSNDFRGTYIAAKADVPKGANVIDVPADHVVTPSTACSLLPSWLQKDAPRLNQHTVLALTMLPLPELDGTTREVPAIAEWAAESSSFCALPMPLVTFPDLKKFQTILSNDAVSQTSMMCTCGCAQLVAMHRKDVAAVDTDFAIICAAFTSVCNSSDRRSRQLSAKRTESSILPIKLNELRRAVAFVKSRCIDARAPAPLSLSKKHQSKKGHVPRAKQPMLVPLVELLNHDASSEFCPETNDDGDVIVALTNSRNQPQQLQSGQELCINYGDESDEHYLLHYGFVPAGNIKSHVSLTLPVACGLGSKCDTCGDDILNSLARARLGIPKSFEAPSTIEINLPSKGPLQSYVKPRQWVALVIQGVVTKLAAQGEAIKMTSCSTCSHSTPAAPVDEEEEDSMFGSSAFDDEAMKWNSDEGCKEWMENTMPLALDGIIPGGGGTLAVAEEVLFAMYRNQHQSLRRHIQRLKETPIAAGVSSVEKQQAIDALVSYFQTKYRILDSVIVVDASLGTAHDA